MTRTLAVVMLVALALGIAGAPAAAHAADPRDYLYALLPVTPAQAREVAALARTPGTLAADVVEVARTVGEVAPSLPGAIVHDVLTAPARDLALLHGLLADGLDLVTGADDAERPTFGRTLRALHRSRLFTAAAGVVRRAVAPGNRTARLAIVLAARAQGLPLDTADLDLLRQAIDRDAPDLGPLVVRVVERLTQAYGRDAVRLILSP
jgi:hypothetical protein